MRDCLGREALRHSLRGGWAGDAGPKPVLRVVSFHADDTNRSPTFDMDLTDLLQDGQPISYSQAKAYFKSDPATRYVCLLLLQPT